MPSLRRRRCHATLISCADYFDAFRHAAFSYIIDFIFIYAAIIFHYCFLIRRRRYYYFRFAAHRSRFLCRC